MDFLPSLEDIGDMIANVLLWFPRNLYKVMIDGVESMLTSSDLSTGCEVVADELCYKDIGLNPASVIQQALDLIPPQGIYILDALHVFDGMQMIFATVLFCYLYSRVPFLGSR